MKQKRDSYLRPWRTAAAILAYSVFIELCVHLITYGQLRIYDNLRHELINHLINIIPIILMTSACTAVIFFVTDRGLLSRHFMLKLLADIVLTAAVTAGLYLLTWLGLSTAFGEEVSVEIHYGSTLAIWMITILVIEIQYYMLSAKAAVRKAEQFKLEALQYQYDAFRAQVNPHFLFNSLNILLDIIETDKERASRFTEALSDIYRYVLSTHHRTRVTVSEEMSFLESYIHILTLKYNNFLEVDINDSLQGTRYIIPFTMQILLENVTKHNTISDRCPMKVTITVDNSGITVRNPVNLRKSTGTGLGLRYLITQYEAAGRQFSASGDGKFFTAIIPYL